MRPAVRKRTWFYYALARLAVARNLAVAAAIAAICVGAVGLALWAAGAKRRADVTAVPGLPGGLVGHAAPVPEDRLFKSYQIGSEGATIYLVDPNQHSELYVTVQYKYKCGHEGSFIPAYSQFIAYDPAGYKAKLEQRLCPACQAQAEYRARKAQYRQAATVVKPDAGR